MDTVINDKRSSFYYIGLNESKKKKSFKLFHFNNKRVFRDFPRKFIFWCFFFPFAISFPINRKESQPKIYWLSTQLKLLDRVRFPLQIHWKLKVSFQQLTNIPGIADCMYFYFFENERFQSSQLKTKIQFNSSSTELSG